MQTGETVRVSTSSNGGESDGDSYIDSISSNGRYILFYSNALNLVPNITSRINQLYLKDMQTGSTTLISKNSAGIPSNGGANYADMSCDGSVIAFSAKTDNLTPEYTTNVADIYLYINNLDGAANRLVNITAAADYASGNPSVSCDGRYIIFGSDARNLLTGRALNQADIYEYEIDTGTLSLISQSSSGQEANANSGGRASVSNDGRYVAFTTQATNLDPRGSQLFSGNGDVYLRDTLLNTTQLVSVTTGGANSGSCYYPAISADGHFIVYASLASNLVSNDTNNVEDVFRFTVPTPTPLSPTSLQAASPTRTPVLNWNSSVDAVSYGIYRDGTKIDSTDNGSYTDNSAPEGTHEYYVTAVNSAGESSPSNTVNVLVDRTAPNITYTQSPAPNDSGWNNTNVTVAYDCNDESSGIQSCSNSTTLSSEGSAQSATGTATDNAGNTSSVTTDNINIDKTAPAVSGATLSSYDVTYGSHNSVAVAASAGDSLSGVIGGEYYVDTDPGHGNGTALDYANNQLLGDADFSSLGTGTHTVYVRAQDAAGNWSDPTSASLTVSYPVPVAPTNLTAVTPSNQKLALSWMAGFDPTTPPAISYNIYRNGALIGTSTTTNFTDNNLSSDGTYTYYVTGVNQYGIESTPSNTVTAVYDTNAPTVIYTVTPAANANGWNNSNVTVAFTCSDELSGIQTCPSSHTFSSDGANQSVTATATDNAGNSKVVTVGSINIDKTPPTVSSVHMSSTVVLSLLPVTITADTADNLSGIVKGEYYIDTDPGQGQATAMTYSNGQLSTSATINLGLGLGTHTLYVRSQDTAGNWSLPVSVSFTYIL
jgi:hypothetical protein